MKRLVGVNPVAHALGTTIRPFRVQEGAGGLVESGRCPACACTLQSIQEAGGTGT